MASSDENRILEKKRKASDSSANIIVESKSGRFTRTPEHVTVSNILKETNSVLFDENDAHEVLNLNKLFDDPDVSVTQNSIHLGDSIPVNMDIPANKSPSNADLMKLLEKIDNRLFTVEEKLGSLKSLEVKVDKFEKEMSKLWTLIHDDKVQTANRISTVEERVESADFNLSIVSSKVQELETKNKQLNDELLYVQSQSMRNNIVFGNIEEALPGETENAESVVRDFLVSKMKLASDLVSEMKFERIHRMGEKRPGKNRPIVAKFNLFKERELVRRAGSALKSTPYFIHEQFPKEVSDKRRKLVPKMKEARDKGSRAWISYDTLFIDGKPFKDSAN